MQNRFFIVGMFLIRFISYISETEIAITAKSIYAWSNVGICRKFFSKTKTIGQKLHENPVSSQVVMKQEQHPEYKFVCVDDVMMVQIWFQENGKTSHSTHATIDLIREIFDIPLISRNGDVSWPSRSCSLTWLDYFLWTTTQRQLTI